MTTSPSTTSASILPRRFSTLAAKRSTYLLGAILIAIIIVMVLPVLLSFLASIKTPEEASAVPPTYIPIHLSLANYAKVFTYQAGLASYVGNSLAVAALTIFFCLALAIPAAYGLARLQLPGRDLIFLLLLLPLMIPYQALLTPLYLTFSGWGLANSYLGLAIIHTILQLPFSVYLLRQNFEAVPREFDEAAMVDGCGELRMLWSIHLPAVRPAIVTVVLFAFVASWNEFIGALIEMGQESKFTVPIMLVAVRMGNHGAVDWGALQAGVIISILPCFLIYLLLQKYYVSGLLSGAVK
ncbi:MAG TPA: carbohydrate ABC transporter permease [Magnetospirillaceae bacterium]|jgi:multiple sugar transport system permease protein